MQTDIQVGIQIGIHGVNNMKKLWFCIALAVSLTMMNDKAFAHFGVIYPSDDIITQGDNKTVHLEVKFIHPNEYHYMEMEKPAKFGVRAGGKNHDLLATLKEAKGAAADQNAEGKSFTMWKADYKITRPGTYTFYLEPKPYWEPAEDKYIIHYTKVCLGALGEDAGWDEPVGAETEIIPLTRPYGLWTANVFTGKVLIKGKPVPNCDVEIEYLNEAPEVITKIKAPSDPYVAQVVKTDDNGVFTYAMPKAGWWGFAALNDASWKMKSPDGKKDKSVEIGAVYWVKTIDCK